MIWYHLGEMILALLLAAVQLAWAPAGRWEGLAPDLVLVLVVLVGLFRGPEEAAWTGLAGGLCLGALTSFPLGGLFVAYMGVGIATGMLGQQIFSDRLPLLMVIVFFAVWIARLIGLVFVPSPQFAGWLVTTLIVALYSALAGLPLGWLARLVQPRAGPALPPPPGSSMLTRRS